MESKTLSSDASIDHIKEISTWVASVTNLDMLLELIIETATGMMNAKASSLLLLDPKTRRLYFKVATGEKKDDIKQFEVELGTGIAGFVAEKGEPLLIPVLYNQRDAYQGEPLLIPVLYNQRDAYQGDPLLIPVLYNQRDAYQGEPLLIPVL